eukprot:COSAG01_NODE_31222_length_601_cov_1.157371_1_plen_55_part_10
MSGGEKFFATLSLLLALGHEAPFLYLDEIDDCMDEKRVEISLRLYDIICSAICTS